MMSWISYPSQTFGVIHGANPKLFPKLLPRYRDVAADTILVCVIIGNIPEHFLKVLQEAVLLDLVSYLLLPAE
jgi:hypothetical protein